MGIASVAVIDMEEENTPLHHIHRFRGYQRSYVTGRLWILARLVGRDNGHNFGRNYTPLIIYTSSSSTHL